MPLCSARATPTRTLTKRAKRWCVMALKVLPNGNAVTTADISSTLNAAVELMAPVHDALKCQESEFVKRLVRILMARLILRVAQALTVIGGRMVEDLERTRLQRNWLATCELMQAASDAPLSDPGQWGARLRKRGRAFLLSNQRPRRLVTVFNYHNL